MCHVYNLIFPSSETSYHAKLQNAFNAVGNDKHALIIVGRMKPTCKEIKVAKKTSIHKYLAKKSEDDGRAHDGQSLLVAIEAVRACNRPPPLLWFESKYSYVSDDKEDIKEWMRGRNKTFSARDLITDFYCMAGYEADLVIYLGINWDVSIFMAKCRGQFVNIL